MTQRRGSYVVFVLGLCFTFFFDVSTALAQDVVFDNRQNVNIVCATNVTFTRGAGGDPTLLRAETDSYWDGGDNPPGGTNWLRIDLKTSRNVKMIRMREFAGYRATNMTVSTSTDGATWTPQAATLTRSGTEDAKLEFASAVDARYVHLAADGLESATRRWIVRALRAYGAPGTLTDPDGVIDLVSRTGWSGGMTFSRIGNVSITDVNDAECLDDGLDPLKRQVLWMVTTNEGFQFGFDRDFIIGAVGFTYPQGDLTSAFQLESSTNGTVWEHWLTRTNVATAYNLHTGPLRRARYMRFTIVKTSNADNRIGDFMAFGHPPVTNRVPLPNSQDVGVTFASPMSFTLSATDPDGDAVTYLLASVPAHGSLSGTVPNLTYSPTYGYAGADTLTFRATDGALTSDVATVTLNVGSAGAVAFDSRQNVNVVNASNVLLTARIGPNPGNLRADCSDWQWDTIGYAVPDGTNWITMDFGTNRNVKTVRLRHWAGYGITNGFVSTSADGAVWSPAAATMTRPSTECLQFVLGSAVETRYLRVTGTAFEDGTRRWIVFSLRVLGDTGILVDGPGDIDLVSGTGFSGGVTLTRNGSVNIVNPESMFVDDAANPIVRNCLWSMGNGDGITVALNQTYVLRQAAIFIQAKTPATLSFNVEVSPDGSAYSSVLAPSGLSYGLTYLSFGAVTGQYVRLTITNGSAGDDDRLSDIQIFGNTLVPPRPQYGSLMLVR